MQFMDLIKLVRHAALRKKSIQYIRRRLLGRLANRLSDSVKMYLIEKGSNDVIWFELF
jgi:hypothetical protein